MHWSLFNFSRLIASQCEGARLPIIVLNLVLANFLNELYYAIFPTGIRSVIG